MKQFSWLLALGAIVVGLAVAGPVSAGPNEMALLSTYIGEWAGSSALVGGKKPEKFSCRLTIEKGNQAKINYAGRCTLTTMNLSVTGTIAFDDATRTYQAIMGSNAGYKGTAVEADQRRHDHLRSGRETVRSWRQCREDRGADRADRFNLDHCELRGRVQQFRPGADRLRAVHEVAADPPRRIEGVVSGRGSGHKRTRTDRCSGRAAGFGFQCRLHARGWVGPAADSAQCVAWGLRQPRWSRSSVRRGAARPRC